MKVSGGTERPGNGSAQKLHLVTAHELHVHWNKALQCPARRRNLAIWFHRLYAPVGCVLIILLSGDWLATKLGVNPLAAAQNPRVRFQMVGDVASAPPVGLTPEETRLAEQVMQPLTEPSRVKSTAAPLYR